MEVGPVVRSDTVTAGYWAHSAERGWHFRQPYDDPMTPLFDEVWEQVMGKHSDADNSGVADAAEEEQRLADLQSRIFHEAGPDDWTSDEEIAAMRDGPQS